MRPFLQPGTWEVKTFLACILIFFRLPRCLSRPKPPMPSPTAILFIFTPFQKRQARPIVIKPLPSSSHAEEFFQGENLAGTTQSFFTAPP